MPSLNIMNRDALDSVCNSEEEAKLLLAKFQAAELRSKLNARQTCALWMRNNHL